MRTSENVSDTYFKRRTIESETYTTVVVKDIKHIDYETIGIIIDVAEEKYIIKCRLNKEWSSAVTLLFDSLNSNTQEIDIVFNSEMNKCGFEQDEYIFDIEYIENKNYSFLNKYAQSESLKTLLLWNEYKKSPSKNKYDVGMTRNIKNINSINESTFELSIFTELDLSWEINIPLCVNSESSTIARFIEEKGGGDPKQLADLGRVIIVNRQDVDDNMEIISYDKTNQWALINPTDYKQWLKNRINKTNTKHRQYIANRNKSFLYFSGYSMLYGITAYLDGIMSPWSNETMTAIVNLSYGLNSVIMGIMIIILFYYSFALIFHTRT